METKIVLPRAPQSLLNHIQERTGQNVLHCYQCGKCTAGCPAAYAMDMTPRQIMRGIQLGLQDDILKSKAIWLCMACETCSVRCPRLIEVDRVMESLRHLAITTRTDTAESEIKLFHRIFLNLISRYGRIYEFGLAGAYNLTSGHLFANVGFLPGMLKKGKLAFLPPKARGSQEVKKIFARVKQVEKAAEASND